jgi:hypothetical protein
LRTLVSVEITSAPSSDIADHPTIHGLRGTGILARAEQGYDVDQIANDIGMTRQNVAHYMRFRDQMKVAVWPQAAANRWQRGLDHEPLGGYIRHSEGWVCKKDLESCKKFGKSRMKSVVSVGNGVTVAQLLSG